MESNVRTLASNLGRIFRPSEAYFVPMEHPRVALRAPSCVSWVRKTLPQYEKIASFTVSVRNYHFTTRWGDLKGVFLIGTSVKKAVPTVRIVQITNHIPRLAKRFTQKTPNQDSG